MGTNVASGIRVAQRQSELRYLCGDDGLLQAIPCSQRQGLSAEAMAASAPHSVQTTSMFRKWPALHLANRWNQQCSTRHPHRYRNRSHARLGATSPLRCIGFVGDSGCGVTSPLEASKRALDSHRSETLGFCANSQLVVVYLADEDDCSVQLAQLSKQSERSPATQPSRMQPTAINVEFRCSHDP